MYKIIFINGQVCCFSSLGLSRIKTENANSLDCHSIRRWLWTKLLNRKDLEQFHSLASSGLEGSAKIKNDPLIIQIQEFLARILECGQMDFKLLRDG
jgi:hypothetical protein